MRLPKIVRFLIWKLFINEIPSGKVQIYNYIVHDEEDNMDAFLVFVAGEKGHIAKDYVDHTDTSIDELRHGLEQHLKVLYNAVIDRDYTITTVIKGEGELPDGFMGLKKKALEEPNVMDKFKSFISGVCYG